MKMTIAGSVGHIGKPLTQELVLRGHQITVISSKAARQEEIEALGASSAIGSMKDVDFLTRAFTGADAVYCMVPFDDFFNPYFDMGGYGQEIAQLCAGDTARWSSARGSTQQRRGPYR